jgi:hypothetical protein
LARIRRARQKLFDSEPIPRQVAVMTRIFPLLAGIVLAGSAPARTFTNTEGKTIEAEVVRATDKQVMLRLENHRSVTIDLATLSAEDQAYIQEWQANRIPRLRFDPNLVSKTDEGFHKQNPVRIGPDGGGADNGPIIVR